MNRIPASSSGIDSPGGNNSTPLATASRGAREVSVIRQRMQAGGQGPVHNHDREEVVYVHSGVLRILAGEEQIELSAGDTAIIPAQTRHQMSNPGSELVELLLIAPAGVLFFDAEGTEMVPEWSK